MTEQFLINFTPQETRVALLQQGVVQELHIERTNGRGIVGNVYLGRVVRVLPGMQSAFVEIGLERTAFLHVADIWSERGGNGYNGHDTRPIERILSEGQSLMVQVQKDPIGTKGARLTTQISIAGRLLVHLPQDNHIGISQRIGDEAERESCAPASRRCCRPTQPGGYILRTVAADAGDEELAADIAYLRRIWSEIKSRSVGALPPMLLHHDLTLAQRVLRDLVNTEPTASSSTRARTSRSCSLRPEYVPQVLPRLVHYTGERPLFDLHGVEDEIQKALARRVDLKSGGYLIFDQTEAMTTIDVNTGGYVGSRNFDDTIFKTNLEAAQTIARQLRLRNLGGIIIADFIDMEDAAQGSGARGIQQGAGEGPHAHHRVRLHPARPDRDDRKRTRESLAHVLCEPCPTCGGRGEVKTAQTICYEVLRELLREARQFTAREMRVVASPSVIDLFLEEESQALAMLSEFIGLPISLHAESGYTQEQFDIVLM
jgi:ribonuclease G